MKKLFFCSSLLAIILSCSDPVELKTYSIKGYIGLDQQVQNIEPFTIRLYQNDLLIATSNSPEFEFKALKEGENYTIIPESNEPSYNGLSTLDLTLVNNYIAGTDSFTPFQFVAADMNKDGIVDATDKDLLFTCVVNNIGCNGHRFVTPDYTPQGVGHVDQIIFEHLNADQQVQFFGIKIGDVSGVTH